MKRFIGLSLVVFLTVSFINCGKVYSQSANEVTINYYAMGDYSGNITNATWYWPIHGYSSTSSAYSKITSSYGYRGGSYQAYHKGIDIGESNGTAVYPVRSGTISVVDNSTNGSEGRSLIINHNDGYFSVYMHLSKINVSQGQAVGINTVIGSVGGSGYGSESYYAYHLHLGIHYGSSFDWVCNVNPCPSGYTRIGNSLQDSAGGYPIGSASISYSVSSTPSEPEDGGQTHSYWRSVEAVHPHREFMVCSCGDSYYTGNNGYYTAYEGAHPHRYYYVCEVENCSYNRTYTGDNATRTAYRTEPPYNEYYVCPVTSCSYHNKDTGNTAKPKNVTIKTSKQTVEINKYILFEFTVENATYWNFVVKKDGVVVTNESISGKYNYSHLFTEEGTYVVEIQAANSYGYTIRGIEMTVTPPQKPYVKMSGDKTTIKIGETINYTFTVENANYWYFVVKKDGEIIRNESMSGKYKCSHTFDEAGEYIVDIQAANNNGWTIYSVKATVKDLVPGKPGLKNFKDVYYAGETITLSWDSTEDTTHYNIYIDKIVEETYDRVETVHYANSGLTKTLEAGAYRVLLQSTNSTNWAYTNGDWVYFTVEAEAIDVNITNKNGETTYSVQKTIGMVDESSAILAVGYKNSKMVDYDKKNYAGVDLDFSLEGDIDEIRIMVWESIDSATPLCEAEVIPQSEWIN